MCQNAKQKVASIPENKTCKQNCIVKFYYNCFWTIRLVNVKRTLVKFLLTSVRRHVSYRRVAVADLPRTSIPQPKGRVDVSDDGRQPDCVSAGLVEMLCQQLSAVGRRIHVVFHQHTGLKKLIRNVWIDKYVHIYIYRF